MSITFVLDKSFEPPSLPTEGAWYPTPEEVDEQLGPIHYDWISVGYTAREFMIQTIADLIRKHDRITQAKG